MEEYRITGFVARDKEDPYVNRDSNLFFGQKKPYFDEDLEMWCDFGEFVTSLPKEWYPNLKYTDNPIEVEVIIRPINNIQNPT